MAFHWGIHGNFPEAISPGGNRSHTKGCFPVGNSHLFMGKTATAVPNMMDVKSRKNALYVKISKTTILHLRHAIFVHFFKVVARLRRETSKLHVRFRDDVNRRQQFSSSEVRPRLNVELFTRRTKL